MVPCSDDSLNQKIKNKNIPIQDTRLKLGDVQQSLLFSLALLHRIKSAMTTTPNQYIRKNERRECIFYK